MTTTIAAVASARGAGQRAVLRISGPRAGAIVSSCCVAVAPGEVLALDRRAAHEVEFDDGVGRVPALLLWMPGPRSFTAEDVAELHLPGQPDLVAQALERLLERGAVLAEPGEFTRRAFENGRIDLTQAEGVAALVVARSRAERRAATALLAGGLERRLRGIRDVLEAVRSLTEASLDFDEADTGHVPVEHIVAGTREARAAIAEALGWERSRVAPTGLARVVLAGAPNAGKSTLFNRLASGAIHEASGAALVSQLAGTTRDAKRGDWVLSRSVTVELHDLAGRVVDGPARVDEGAPDALADRTAARLAETADLVVWVVDASERDAAGPPGAPVRDRARLVLAWNKSDVEGAPGRPPEALTQMVGEQAVLSGDTGDGVDGLRDAVLRALGAAGAPDRTADGALGLGARHVRALELADDRTAAALDLVTGDAALDLVAEELSAATDALDGITGRTTPEDLLDRIFARFCLGK